MELNIEIYTERYKHSVAGLILGIQNGEFRIPITLELQPDLNEIPKFYQVNNGNFWIAKTNDKVIGTIGLLDIGNNQSALRKMFVDQDYRGKNFGVGQALLDSLIDWARQKGITDIFLGTTEKFIGAQKFYEKNGFAEMQKQDLPGDFPVMVVDTKFYRYSVSS
jgi:N-acetylglutamate synthase-like GNAT family acetyltransferase